MIQTNYFNIYNASAGTGKTFSLVRDYLVLLFNSKNNELYKMPIFATWHECMVKIGGGYF